MSSWLFIALAVFTYWVGTGFDPARAQSSPHAPNVTTWGKVVMPPGAPSWFNQTWHAMLTAPQPNLIYSTPGVPLYVQQYEFDADSAGTLEAYNPAGPTYTPANAFFLPLGANGRACITCHEPTNAFGLSLASIQLRYATLFGRDPLFAPVDGATCPKNVQPQSTFGSLIGGYLGGGGSTSPLSPYYALLTKGLIRIPLPVPAHAEYTVTVVSDPFGCNTDPRYNQVVNADGSTSQILSVYRRPLISANLKFKVQSAANSGLFPPIDPLSGTPLPIDAQGNLENGNIMWDGREATLSSQAIDATLTHAQALSPPSAVQVAQMVGFESSVYTAQQFSFGAGDLTYGGASGGPLGGPVRVAGDPTGTFPAVGAAAMTVYNSYNTPFALPMQASIYRGQQIFNTRRIVIGSVAGLNDARALGQPFQGTCAFCHDQGNVGYAPLPVSQLDLGVGGSDARLGGPLPANDLPVFLFTCTNGKTTPFIGSQVLTNDPGRGLITGKCSDLGRMTTPGLRGLSGHAPYFSDGSAPGLADVVNFYNARFSIGLSTQDRQDLVNFLSTL